MTKLKVLLIIVLICFLLVPNFVSSEDPYNPWTDDWGSVFNSIGIFGFFGADSNFDPGEELNWYPLADWEYQVCSETLTSEFFYDAEAGGGHSNFDSRVYDHTVAVNAEIMETDFVDENDKPEYLLSVGWYIQAANLNDADRVVKYKVKLRPKSYYLNLGDGETEKEFTLMTGTSGFYSNYTTRQYESVDLIIDNNMYTFDIIKKNIEGQIIDISSNSEE